MIDPSTASYKLTFIPPEKTRFFYFRFNQEQLDSFCRVAHSFLPVSDDENAHMATTRALDAEENVDKIVVIAKIVGDLIPKSTVPFWRGAAIQSLRGLSLKQVEAFLEALKLSPEQRKSVDPSIQQEVIGYSAGLMPGEILEIVPSIYQNILSCTGGCDNISNILGEIKNLGNEKAKMLAKHMSTFFKDSEASRRVELIKSLKGLTVDQTGVFLENTDRFFKGKEWAGQKLNACRVKMAQFCTKLQPTEIQRFADHVSDVLPVNAPNEQADVYFSLLRLTAAKVLFIVEHANTLFGGIVNRQD